MAWIFCGKIISFTESTTTTAACAGTGGTITGTGKYLKEQNPHIKVIALDSINSYRATCGHPKPYKVEGMGIDFDSPVIDYSVIDKVINVSDDNALAMLKILAQQYGFLVGPSSGAAAYVAHEYAKKLLPENVMVVIFSDSGRAYLTKKFY